MKMKRKNGRSIREMFGGRFRAGSYSAFSAVIVIVIAVIANMAVGALPSAATQIDVTNQSLYSLSNQTKSIAASLEKDVNLYLICTTGNEDTTITRLMDRYAELSDHIKVSVVDPNEQPTFLDAYDLSTTRLYQNSILADCEGRYRLVSYADIYKTEYSVDYSTYNYTTTTSFNGENELTNAIHYVSSDELPKLYVLSGHGEQELSDSITDAIAQDNMETEDLSLLSLEAVPEDADAVLINAPASDISADEAEMLISYLDNGGSVALISGYIDEGEMENLLSVTDHMGLTTQTGLVIEGDSTKHMTRYPHYLLPNIESHEITEDLIDGGYYVMLPIAQAIAETGDENAFVTALLTSSDSAYAKVDGMNATTTDKEDGDTDGPFDLAVVSELNDGKFFWVICSDFLNESIDMMVSGANSDLYLNTLGWMCDQPESISIRSKSLDAQSLTVTASQNSFWSIVMVGLIPAACIAIGIIITVRRKKR